MSISNKKFKHVINKISTNTKQQFLENLPNRGEMLAQCHTDTTQQDELNNIHYMKEGSLKTLYICVNLSP